MEYHMVGFHMRPTIYKLHPLGHWLFISVLCLGPIQLPDSDGRAIASGWMCRATAGLVLCVVMFAFYFLCRQKTTGSRSDSIDVPCKNDVLAAASLGSLRGSRWG